LQYVHEHMYMNMQGALHLQYVYEHMCV